MNTLATPVWITRQLLYSYSSTPPQSFTVSNVEDFTSWDDVTDVAPVAPLSGKAVIALGIAAVIASPRKVSRRGFLGLGWKT